MIRINNTVYNPGIVVGIEFASASDPVSPLCGCVYTTITVSNGLREYDWRGPGDIPCELGALSFEADGMELAEVRPMAAAYARFTPL